MNKRIEDRELLNEVLADAASEELRQATLRQGLKLMGRKRACRRAWRIACTAIPLIALAAMFLWPSRQTENRRASNQSPAPPMAHTEPKMIAGTSIRILNDQELLDLFKDRPVALVSEPGQQRLLLLDEVPN